MMIDPFHHRILKWTSLNHQVISFSHPCNQPFFKLESWLVFEALRIILSTTIAGFDNQQKLHHLRLIMNQLNREEQVTLSFLKVVTNVETNNF